MGEVSVASLNVNGARDIRKRAALYEVFTQKRLDVIFLQETHSDADNAVDWTKEWEGFSVLSHNTSLSGGVAVLFSKNFAPISYDVDEVIKGRLLKVRAVFETSVLVLICVYAPTSAIQRMLFLDTLNSTLQKCNSEEFLFLGGDFNCTEQSCDRNHLEPHEPSRKKMIQVIKTHELCDVWRQINGTQRQYTWAHSRDRFLSLARLDRFYAFKHQFGIFSKCFIVPVGVSDHSMVCCSFVLNSFKPRSAYWHFNTSLLNDKGFKDTFKVFWDSFRASKDSFSSLRQWWDFGKVQIKQLCQQYTRNITVQTLRSMHTLETSIIKLQELAGSDGNNSVSDTLSFMKKKLSDLLGVKVQGSLVRSRFINIDQMDAPTKFFFNLEKKNGQKKFIHALRAESGVVFFNPIDIRERAVCFYKSLYSSESIAELDTNDVFFQDLPQVSKEANAKLCRGLSLGELYEALNGMESGKAPGIDGLPVDFYKSFWTELGRDLLSVLNESLAEGLLPLSCRRAVLTLLPKKGDLTDIKNWRPVSLLCSDYKLLSKVLAIRLAKVVNQVIHPDQSYCIPDRSIFDNISIVRDIFDVSRLLNLECALVSLDQEKAFDRVEHKYLWKCLAAFGFCQKFIKQVMVLYSEVESVLKVNGGLCNPFKVGRGVRQGCSLSGMLYSLAIEPLLQQIRLKLDGLHIPMVNSNVHLSAYADDVVVFISNQKDFDILLEILTDFNVLSSAKVNWNKSQALMCGNGTGKSIRLPDGIPWLRGGFKYLGVFLGDEHTVQKNWDGIVDKVKGRLAKWKWLAPKLSYKGRTLIINNLVASSLWHKLACIDPPSKLLAEIQAILVDFFWDKLHWIPQSFLFLPKEEGGQGLLNLQSRTAAFRLQFIQRLLAGATEPNWKTVACFILQSLGGLQMDRSLFLLDSLKLDTSGLPVFYHNLFKVWSLFNIQRTQCFNSLYWLLKEPIVHGARLDFSASDCIVLGLNRILCSADCRITNLGQLLYVAGPTFSNTEQVSSRLKIISTRVTAQLLVKWQSMLTDEERQLLWDYSAGAKTPDSKDPFPELMMSPKIGDCDGVFLKIFKSLSFNFFLATGKLLYKMCVLVFNKKVLEKKVDTPWRSFFNLDEDVKPEWRVLYKPPLAKRVGDIQWRVLHGAIAVNAFISILNPEISADCPFCFKRETVFHAFAQCSRLDLLFNILRSLFICFNDLFSVETFILGVKYTRNRRFDCQLLNFIVGQAKLAVYTSRKSRIEKKPGQDVSVVFKALIKSRVLIDFNFYKSMNDLPMFELKWSNKGALCSVFEGELLFSHLF